MLDVDCLTGARWTAEELTYLRGKYGLVSDNILAADLRRSLSAIRKRVTLERRHGRMPPRPAAQRRAPVGVFQPRDPAIVDRVIERRPHRPYREIARELGISTSTVAGIIRDHRARLSP